MNKKLVQSTLAVLALMSTAGVAHAAFVASGSGTTRAAAKRQASASARSYCGSGKVQWQSGWDCERSGGGWVCSRDHGCSNM